MNKTNPFSIASLICGILSIVVCCCGFLSVPLGALSILFALLARRREQRMDGMSITGIVTSVVGMIGGIVFLLVLNFSDSFMGISDPTYQEELYESMEELYGEEMADYIFEFYGID